MTQLNQTEATSLKSYVERIERLNEEKSSLASDISDLFKDAGSKGFDTKALKQVLRLRKKNRDERESEMDALTVYLHALGM